MDNSANKKLLCVITFGCQMNVHDSEAIAGYFADMGYDRIDDPKQADVIMINTCTIRETADNKVFALLGRLRPLKVRKPQLIIGVCGCLTQQPKIARRIKHRFPFVDLVIGTTNLHRLPELVGIVQARDRQDTIVEVNEAGKIVEQRPFKRDTEVKAWVTIMNGCNNFCTYCIVPYVRGRERSRKPEDIIEEISYLVANGYKEVTLLGQNVNSYGKDFTEKYSFSDLLQNLNEINGLERIRYMTSHPRDFSKETINVIARCSKVCESFHLPIQSGSDRLLKLMNRGYTREHYLGLAEEIKRLLPQATITSDIIVGFPGETKEDFEQTLDMVRRVGFDHSFTFIYNRRPGTPAADMDEQISEEVKKQRIQELVNLQNSITLEHNSRQVGKTEEILVEGFSKTNDDLLSGKTRNNRMVVFPGSPDLIGQLVPVKIRQAKLLHLVGSLA